MRLFFVYMCVSIDADWMNGGQCKCIQCILSIYRKTDKHIYRVCGMEFQEQTSKIPNSHLYCHSVQIFSKKKTVCMCVNGFKNRRENEWMNESKFYDQ